MTATLRSASVLGWSRGGERAPRNNLQGIMTTFGRQACYDDEPWSEHHDSRDAVRHYYEDLLVALPDLRIDIAHRLAAEDAVALEVRISDTHLGPWSRLPPTGWRVEFPLCGLFTFDEEGKLAGERMHTVKVRPYLRLSARLHL